MNYQNRKIEALTFGSLFAGIGGIDLGFERAGWKCSWQVEIDAYARSILEHQWPDVVRFRDVRRCGKNNLIPVDCITGGFPCQPHSVAGKRKGSQDERDLWGEFARIIRELKPKWVLAENVPGLLTTEKGRFFGGILRDLAAAGYDAYWQVFSAAQFGAPHLRKRLFLIAKLAHASRARRPDRRNSSWPSPLPEASFYDAQYGGAYLANPFCFRGRLEKPHDHRQTWQDTNTSESTLVRRKNRTVSSEGSETCRDVAERQGRRIPQSCMGRGINGFPSWMDFYKWPVGYGEKQEEWEPPRVLLEHIPNQRDRLKVIGNAVVPQIAEYIAWLLRSWTLQEQYASFP